MNHIALGIAGEKKAVKFLKKHKYKILEKNYRCALGEVDVIARQGETLVFVEVKTRSSCLFGRPCEAVDEQKQEKLRRLALYYQRFKRLYNIPLRFDVVEVLDNEINLIEGAF